MLFDVLKWFDSRPPDLNINEIEQRAITLISSHSDDYNPNDPSPDPIPPYCNKGSECSFIDDCDFADKAHHVPLCKVQQLRTDRAKLPCNFFIQKELIIAPLAPSDTRFVAVARFEALRDLLLMPCVPCKDPQLHDNTQLARSHVLWKSVIELVNRLTQLSSSWGIGAEVPLERIALNFGKWETAASKDERALYCHGHVHFVLTRRFAEAFSSRKNFQILRGCVRHHHVVDYESLLVSRINSLRSSQIHLRLNHLETRMSSLRI